MAVSVGRYKQVEVACFSRALQGIVRPVAVVVSTSEKWCCDGRNEAAEADGCIRVKLPILSQWAHAELSPKKSNQQTYDSTHFEAPTTATHPSSVLSFSK